MPDILEKCDQNQVEIGILFCDSQTIIQMNTQYRKKKKVTDVLSFPMDESQDNTEDFVQPPGLKKYFYLGDIAICLEQALKQSKDFGFTLEAEILRLLIHGTLHLLGYDHETNQKEAKIMMDKEKSLLQEVDVKIYDQIH